MEDIFIIRAVYCLNDKLIGGGLHRADGFIATIRVIGRHQYEHTPG
jgi:hypothetical protein